MNEFEESLIKLIDELFNLTDKEHQEILMLYKNSRNNIKDFVADLFMKYGDDGYLDMSDLRKYNRIQKLEQQIKEELSSLAAGEVAIMAVILGAVYSTSFYKTVYTIEQQLQMGIDFRLLRKELIDEVVNYNWSGVPFSERIWDNTNALVKGLRTELYLSIQQGESLDRIARRINKQFDSKAYQSQRLIRTESARIITAAQEKIYEDSGVIDKVRYLATLEGNTCSICAKSDNKVFRVDDSSKPNIPRHPNCRCAYAPFIEGDNHNKRKDNETKEIIKNLSYDEWYKQRISNR